MKFCRTFLPVVSTLVFTLQSATTVFADQLQAGATIIGSDPGKATNRIVASGTASAALAGDYGSSSASASFGSLSVNSTAIRTANGSKRGFTGAGATWSDTFTIQPGNPALNGTPGTAVITFHLSGDINGHLVGFQQGIADYSIVWGEATQYRGYFQNNDEFVGPTIESLSTFTRTIPFNFGTPTAYEMSLNSSAEMGTGADPGSASVHVSLTQGGITVLDNTSTPTAYTSTSSAGASRASQITNGASYAGFALNNSTGHQTTLSLLDGTANSNQWVTATFVGTPNTNQLASDVVDLSGAGTNVVVVQMNYDPLASLLDLVDPSALSLLWQNPDSGNWTNAVAGNSDLGAFIEGAQRAYDFLKDFKLGKYGVDTTNHTVWAVVDHNSRFAVGVAFGPASAQWNSIKPQTNSVTLTLQGPSLGQYMIETNTDLLTTNWGVLKLMTLNDSGTNTLTDTNTVSNFQQKYYRARQ